MAENTLVAREGLVDRFIFHDGNNGNGRGPGSNNQANKSEYDRNLWRNFWHTGNFHYLFEFYQNNFNDLYIYSFGILSDLTTFYDPKEFHYEVLLKFKEDQESIKHFKLEKIANHPNPVAFTKNGIKWKIRDALRKNKNMISIHEDYPIIAERENMFSDIELNQLDRNYIMKLIHEAIKRIPNDKNGQYKKRFTVDYSIRGFTNSEILQELKKLYPDESINDNNISTWKRRGFEDLRKSLNNLPDWKNLTELYSNIVEILLAL